MTAPPGRGTRANSLLDVSVSEPVEGLCHDDRVDRIDSDRKMFRAPVERFCFGAGGREHTSHAVVGLEGDYPREPRYQRTRELAGTRGQVCRQGRNGSGPALPVTWQFFRAVALRWQQPDYVRGESSHGCQVGLSAPGECFLVAVATGPL
ncbi:hypothetical protein GCM10011492_09500 [Flexivirga endophytica]|uniref:Uncharacterized protein n=1 Tax=Flexivirga endophytica TaxID=1849103 RepID=A0A916SZN4_9MICO|nr:hypothetical protein GCM10011492_09500 [Flexivirga endophytica]GHB59321.1 hypothetical protein GCM10008112_30520 [Flexivirga endophytica]